MYSVSVVLGKIGRSECRAPRAATLNRCESKSTDRFQGDLDRFLLQIDIFQLQCQNESTSRKVVEQTQNDAI